MQVHLSASYAAPISQRTGTVADIAVIMAGFRGAFAAGHRFAASSRPTSALTHSLKGVRWPNVAH